MADLVVQLQTLFLFNHVRTSFGGGSLNSRLRCGSGSSLIAVGYSRGHSRGTGRTADTCALEDVCHIAAGGQ